MGKANTQIATRANVNSKRLGAFVTGSSISGATYMKKCVTKAQVDNIEYLQVNDRITSKWIKQSSKNSHFGWGEAIEMGIYSSVTYEETLDANNLTYDSDANSIYCLMYAPTSENTSTRISYNCEWPSYNHEYYALFAQNITNVPTNSVIELEIDLTIYPIIADSSSGLGGVSTYEASSINWNPGIVITNSDNSYVVATHSPIMHDNTHVMDSLIFSSTYSSINIYIIVPYINMTFYPRMEEYFTGFRIDSSIKATYTESHYDQTYKLVQYQDIANKSSRTFTCYYGIYNNKSSSAQLDYVRAYIGATSDRNKGTWTQIGSTDPGSVSSTKTGSFTCTIPSTIDLSKQYYMYVHCGETFANQDWHSGWGASSSAANVSQGHVDNAKTSVQPLQDKTSSGSTYRVLNAYNSGNGSIPVLMNGVYGRSSAYAAWFKIT